MNTPRIGIIIVKNALDHAYAAFNRKPIAMLGYGNAR